MRDERGKTLSIPEQEEKILKFWEEHKIFEKSIAQRKGAKRFVFYDGPPFATGLPHYGHILGSTVKDAVPRFWTMRGYRVDRRWGWDCHGLPIEHLVEQELKISGRKAIEQFGIKKFNETARSKVLTYAEEWYKTVRRIGRFVDFTHSYKTMDASYMESVWWAFAALYKKGLIYKDARTSLFCTRCETPLSNFEIAMDNSYRDETHESAYVKLPLADAKNEFLLIWTTTPWTIPGNAAVAVNPKIEYTKFGIGHEHFWSAATPPHGAGRSVVVLEKRSGKSLVGLSYEPPFRLTADASVYRVAAADFVGLEEGTGLVHIAPAFGEEDFLLGKKERLPMFSTLDDTGRFSAEYPELGFLEGKSTDEANTAIIEELKKKGFLWKTQKIVHRYPVCWRCATPLIYKVQPAWFVNVASLKPNMLALNEKIDWHPAHLKYGRFKNGIEMAPDWNVSRSRFWGTPIPIWECGDCNKVHVVGSRKEFDKKSRGSRNTYFLMRHGESLSNVQNVVAAKNGKYPLTPLGRKQAQRAAEGLKERDVDMITASPILRARQTAEIVADALDIKKIHFDRRLREIEVGILEGKTVEEYNRYFSSARERLTRKPPQGESLSDVRRRSLALLEELEKKYRGKTILFISHSDPLWMVSAAAAGLSNEETMALRKGRRARDFMGHAEVLEARWRHVPRNDSGELDFHRPYVDEVPLFCECGGALKRIPDVFDCWFESGSMPFAEKHYPFESKKIFEENFPADFISEYVNQTRGWFYTLHILSTALFGKPAFRHGVSTGVLLSEKGEKLSKSRNNFPDPWLLFGRYGVDAIRFSLMSSPVMLAESTNFSEKEVDEVYKKYLLTARNILNFFILFRGRPKKSAGVMRKPTHVLDRWILSRLSSTTGEITRAMEQYEISASTKPLFDFVQDLSLWYVRRSRQRLKSPSPDAALSLSTLRTVLFEFSRLAAPITPFLAETVYQGVGMGKKASVHLEEWPKGIARFFDEDLEEKMRRVRAMVSLALRLRAEAGIKVRQPLRELRIADHELRGEEELLALIKDEVNVKEIVFGKEVGLDTAITPELREEGIMRELIRNIQEMRRDLGLKPHERIRCQIAGDRGLEEIVERGKDMLRAYVHAEELKIGGKKVFRVEREVALEGKQLWMGISP